jgi:quercetin dioxygenase-like cupin family protein
VRKSSDLEWESAGDGGQIARLFTKGEHGADFVFGYTRLLSGGSLSFDLASPSPPRQEAYLMEEGEITLSWEDGGTTLAAGSAAFFPEGRVYEVRNDGDREAIWLYVAIPAPR